MIVPKPVEGGDGLLRVALVVVVDEGEALALAGDLVLGEEDPGGTKFLLGKYLSF